MNTPAHLLIGAAVCARPAMTSLLICAFFGAMLPDLSLYLLAGGSIYVLGISPARVFNELYFSDAWQTVFAIDNSFFVWGALLLIATWKSFKWLQVLSGAAIMHLMFDLPLHHDDGRAHFWPLSNWVFQSPLSYWDSAHGAGWVAPIEAVLAAACAIALWVRKMPVWAVVATAILLIAEIWVVYQWLFVFEAG